MLINLRSFGRYLELIRSEGDVGNTDFLTHPTLLTDYARKEYIHAAFVRNAKIWFMNERNRPVLQKQIIAALWACWNGSSTCMLRAPKFVQSARANL